MSSAIGDVVMGAGLWTYVADSPRPHVHPVRTPSGRVLSRDAPADHPWHHALWFTIKFVERDNFWEEMGDHGVLRHVAAPVVDADAGALSATIEWVPPGPDAAPVIDQHLTLHHVPLDGERAYAIDVGCVLVTRSDLVLDRTPFTTWGGYGGLAWRGRGDWRDTRLLADDGLETDRVEGRPGRWLDLTGTVDGALAGVAVLDHPANPRHPVPWYASTRHATYGGDEWSNFLNAAFLFHEPLRLARGDALELRYRVVVHDGVLSVGELESLYGAFAALSPPAGPAR